MSYLAQSSMVVAHKHALEDALQQIHVLHLPSQSAYLHPLENMWQRRQVLVEG